MIVFYPDGTVVVLRPDELLAWYTPEQVAEMLEVNIRTIHEWIAEGKLPASRISMKVVRISAIDLVSFMQSHKKAN